MVAFAYWRLVAARRDSLLTVATCSCVILCARQPSCILQGTQGNSSPHISTIATNKTILITAKLFRFKTMQCMMYNFNVNWYLCRKLSFVLRSTPAGHVVTGAQMLKFMLFGPVLETPKSLKISNRVTTPSSTPYRCRCTHQPAPCRHTVRQSALRYFT